jgi:hypothetical protein
MPDGPLREFVISIDTAHVRMLTPRPRVISKLLSRDVAAAGEDHGQATISRLQRPLKVK